MDRTKLQSLECPVCGRILQKQLSDEKDVFGDSFWTVERIRFLSGDRENTIEVDAMGDHQYQEGVSLS